MGTQECGDRRTQERENAGMGGHEDMRTREHGDART